MGQWHFETQSPGAMRRAPKESQLFRTEEAGENEYAGNDALVREVLQNAVDAAVSRHADHAEPVRVRFALFEEEKAPPTQRLAQYFARLAPGLKTFDVSIDDDGVPNLPRRFLVVEDFGTRGLTGDPLRHRDPPKGQTGRHDFYWFWRNVGRSGKGDDDLGRWGLGKTVYEAASQIRCRLGLTRRHDDDRSLLFGQATLDLHEFEGQEYVPEGFWCRGVESKGPARGLPLPIEEADELASFAREWHLERGDQPGLSVVVPFVPEELTADHLLKAVCVHFFLPIVRGQLEVVVEGAKRPDGGRVEVTRETIQSVCFDVLKWDGKIASKMHQPPPIGFVRECLAAQAEATPTEVLGETSVPSAAEPFFDDETTADLIARYQSEKLVAVRVRLSLPKLKGPAVVGEAFVFVQNSTSHKRVDAYGVREGMTITKVNSASSRRGVRGLLLVERTLHESDKPNPLASLLGDTEGPAHETWDTAADRPARTWKTWKGRVKFVRKLIDELETVLNPKSSEADFNLLAHLFQRPKDDAPPKPTQTPGGTDDDTTKPGPIVVEPNARWFEVRPRSGGFRLTASKKIARPAGARLRLRVAYDTAKGDPLKKWSPLDFVFKGSKTNGELTGPKIVILGKGIDAERGSAGNEVLVTPSEDRFSLGAEGFDPNRDLLVWCEDELPTDEPGKPADEANESSPSDGEATTPPSSSASAPTPSPTTTPAPPTTPTDLGTGVLR